MGSHGRFQSRNYKTEAIIPGPQEKREDRRQESFLGRGNGMCKGPEARKGLVWSKSTAGAGVILR